jgi:hypothetical protein
MDVSMDGLVHPVREIYVRKYVLVYSLEGARRSHSVSVLSTRMRAAR